MSRLKATAAEYRPKAAAAAAAAEGDESGDGHNNHIKSLEELQLPDGFSAGD
jgi:hypothetical protein